MAQKTLLVVGSKVSMLHCILARVLNHTDQPYKVIENLVCSFLCKEGVQCGLYGGEPMSVGGSYC